MMRQSRFGKAFVVVAGHACAIGLAMLIGMLASGSFSIIGTIMAEEAPSDRDRAAAAEGDAAALVRLATRYETGDAVPVDLDHAAALLEQAALRGDVTAQYRFGLLRAGDLDQEDDLVEAYGWLRLAEKAAPESDEALLGDAIAEALSQRLDDAAVDKAEAWAAAFAPISGPVDLTALLGETDPRVELARLEQDLESLGCGRPLQPDGGMLLAYASAGSAGDGLADLRAGFADHGIALDVAALATPVCALRSLLTTRPDRVLQAGVALADVAPDDETVLREGDRLIVEIEAANDDRYIAVDYVVHTGDVLHLHPADEGEGRLSANEALRLGDGGDGRQPWEIGPPFGRDMLVVTIGETPPPADRQGRPMVEPLEAYLAEWRARIDRADADPPWQVFSRVILTTGG